MDGALPVELLGAAAATSRCVAAELPFALDLSIALGVCPLGVCPIGVCPIGVCPCNGVIDPFWPCLALTSNCPLKSVLPAIGDPVAPKGDWGFRWPFGLACDAGFSDSIPFRWIAPDTWEFAIPCTSCHFGDATLSELPKPPEPPEPPKPGEPEGDDPFEPVA